MNKYIQFRNHTLNFFIEDLENLLTLKDMQSKTGNQHQSNNYENKYKNKKIRVDYLPQLL